MAITNENRLLWELRFRERKEQGLTIAEWCRQNGFTEITPVQKPMAITRKNSLFSDSIAGAEAPALIFSILQTVSANGLDGYRYVEYLFRKLPGLEKIDAPGALEEYLPWSENVQREYRIRKKEEKAEEISCESA